MNLLWTKPYLLYQNRFGQKVGLQEIGFVSKSVLRHNSLSLTSVPFFSLQRAALCAAASE